MIRTLLEIAYKAIPADGIVKKCILALIIVTGTPVMLGGIFGLIPQYIHDAWMILIIVLLASYVMADVIGYVPPWKK